MRITLVSIKAVVVLLLVVVCIAAAPVFAADVSGAGATKSCGLHVTENGVLVKDGKPFYGIGVDYFSAFYRALEKPGDTSYREGFKGLGKYKIPVARVMACGFWPSENQLYFKDKKHYFELMDDVVKSARENGVGLYLSLFWNPSCVPDMVGEPCNQWGNPNSKTHAFMRQYVRTSLPGI